MAHLPTNKFNRFLNKSDNGRGRNGKENVIKVERDDDDLIHAILNTNAEVDEEDREILGDKVKELENQLQLKEEQWKRWETENKMLVTKLQSSLEAEKKLGRELREEMDRQKKDDQFQITSLKTQFLDALNQNQVLSQKLNSQSSEAAIHKSNLNSKTLEVETIRNQNLVLKRDLESTKTLNEELRFQKVADVTRLQQKMNMIQTELEQYKELNSQLQSKLEVSNNSPTSPTTEATIVDLTNQIKKLTYENGKLLVEKRSLLKNSSKNGSDGSQRLEQQINELNKMLELEKGNSEKLLRDFQLKVSDNNELQVQINHLQLNLQDLNEKILHQKNKIKNLNSLKKEKQDFNQLQEELLLKQQEITKLENENQNLLNQIRKSSEVVTKLIEENSSMIQEQQYKKKLNSTLERAVSISSLMSEKQFLCSQLHLKNIALEKETQEKNELKQRLQFYEQTTHDEVHIPINPTQNEIIPTFANESTLSMPPTDQNFDLVDPPLIENPISLPEPTPSVPPLSQPPNGHFHIDNTFKPTHEAIVIPQPVSKGWWSSIWDVVSGRV